MPFAHDPGSKAKWWPFIFRYARLLCACRRSLVIFRSGAARRVRTRGPPGKPIDFLVPFPLFAADNHQTRTAQAMDRGRAASAPGARMPI